MHARSACACANKCMCIFTYRECMCEQMCVGEVHVYRECMRSSCLKPCTYSANACANAYANTNNGVQTLTTIVGTIVRKVDTLPLLLGTRNQIHP